MVEERTKSEIFKEDLKSHCQDINLKQILSEEEIAEYFKDIITYKEELKEDKARDSISKQNKINSILFDRNNLIDKILNFTSDKLYTIKEKSMSKAIEWVIKEVKKMKNSNERNSFAIEKAKLEANANDETTNIFNFIEEYSSSQNKHKDSLNTYSRKSNKYLQQINLTDNLSSSTGVNTTLNYIFYRNNNPSVTTNNTSNNNNTNTNKIPFSKGTSNNFNNTSNTNITTNTNIINANNINNNSMNNYFNNINSNYRNNALGIDSDAEEINLSAFDLSQNSLDVSINKIDKDNNNNITNNSNPNSNYNIISNNNNTNTNNPSNHTNSSLNLLKLNKVIKISDKFIETIDSPDFNIFQLLKETSNVLQVISNIIFIKNCYYIAFDYEKMDNFLVEIEKGYKSNNHYHNAIHAADVTQTCLVYARYAELKNVLKLSFLDSACLFLSAIVHDYKHPGFNNAYMVNSKHEIAIRYNDISVLENYHIAETFSLINSNDKFNIFKTFNVDELKPFRKRMIDMVLNTDMSFHSKLLNQSKLKEEVSDLNDKTNGEQGTKLYSLQQDYLNILLHAADISNASKPTYVYVQWAEKVINEFWNQGDIEKQQNLPVSFLCDRETVTLAKSQIGFIEGVVQPYFVSLNACFNNRLYFLIDNIDKNKKYYKKLKELDDMKEDSSKPLIL